MSGQKIFSRKMVKFLADRLSNGGTDIYLQGESFAKDLKTLESPNVDHPEHLRSRVNPKNDTQTAIALYEAYPDLAPLEASDEGFWTYMTHVELWDYMRARVKLEGLSGESLRMKIKENWFLGDPSQSRLMQHPLAGLWWGVKMTVDESFEDKYALTKILFRNLDLPSRTLGTYYLGRLPSAVRGILRYVYDHPEEFKESYEAKMRFVMKHFNSVGGTLQLGCLDEKYYYNEMVLIKDQIAVQKRSKNRVDPKL